MQKHHTNPLTRKAGPLPVYAYLLLALAAFLFLRANGAKAAGGAGLPYTGTSGSAAQQPASGQGSPADNGNSDLLAALGANGSAADALLQALQGGGQGSTGSGSGGGTSGAGGGSSTESTTAPTVTDSPTPGTFVAPSGSGSAFTGGAPGGVISGDPEHNAFVTGGSDVDPFGVTTTSGQSLSVRDEAYAGALGVPTYTLAAAQPVTSPTPYATVTPAPVDTSSVVVAPTASRTVPVAV